MVPVTDEEARAWAGRLPAPPAVVTMGALKLVPLQLEAGAAIGSLESRLYDATKGWTSTVGVTRCK